MITCHALSFCKLSQIVIVIVVLDLAFLGLFAIVYRCLDLRSYNCHLCHDTLHLNEAVDEISLETSWSDIVLSKISLKVHVVGQGLFGKMNISTLSGYLLLILLTAILLHSSHSLIKLILKNFDGLNGLLGNILAEPGVKLPHLINIHTEALSSANQVLYPASVLWEAHELIGRLLHRKLLLVSAHACGSSSCHIIR